MPDAARAAATDTQPPDRRRPGRRAEVSREDWIETGLTELGHHGHGALRLDRLCERLKITKGSFYWHFPGREAFMRALLDRWEARDTLALIEHVEAHATGPEAKLRLLFDEANSGRVDFRIEQAIRHWGHSAPEIRPMLHRVDARRIAYLEGLFAELGAASRAPDLATLLYGLIFGEAMVYRREPREARGTRRRGALDALLTMARSPE
jgi:AcrR family transcriptional regulator